MKFLVVALFITVPAIFADDSAPSAALSTCEANGEKIRGKLSAMTTFDSNLPGEIFNDFYMFITSVSYDAQQKITTSYMNTMSTFSSSKIIYDTLNEYTTGVANDIRVIMDSQNFLFQQKIERASELYRLTNDLELLKDQLTDINKETEEACKDYDEYFVGLVSAHTDLQNDIKTAGTQEAIEKLISGKQRFHFADFTVTMDIDSIYYNMFNSNLSPLEKHVQGWQQVSEKFNAKIDEIRNKVSVAAVKSAQNVQSDASLTDDRKKKLLASIESAKTNANNLLEVVVKEFNNDRSESVSKFQTITAKQPSLTNTSYNPTIMLDSRVSYAVNGLFINSEIDSAFQIFNDL